MEKIAIVGAGVSGLVAAHCLSSRHDVTVFEAGAHAGGHAWTLPVEVEGHTYPVDVGFMVYNEATYPEFTHLLEQLGVRTRPTEMSFGVKCERSGLEYCGSSLNGFFAQRSNLLRPRFYGLARDVLRFNREARKLLATGIDAPTLRAFLVQNGYGRMFVEKFIVPMGAAIWSSSPDRLLDFPADFFLRFFDNHGLLSVDDHHQWRVIAGGSRRYVEKLTAPFADRIRLRTPVLSVRRETDAVRLRLNGGRTERFGRVVLATHADQSLELLEDPSDAEREILRAFPYQSNEAALHWDASLLPRRPRARASWNYHVPRRPVDRVCVTYDLRRLQGHDSPFPLLLTLNHLDRIDPDAVLKRMDFWHPVFTPASIAAQARHGEISGARNTFYCGAYWRNGFHEDGVRSALAVARQLDSEAVAA
jgi:predicted NAD/FAD-binding protein